MLEIIVSLAISIVLVLWVHFMWKNLNDDEDKNEI